MKAVTVTVNIDQWVAKDVLSKLDDLEFFSQQLDDVRDTLEEVKMDIQNLSELRIDEVEQESETLSKQLSDAIEGVWIGIKPEDVAELKSIISQVYDQGLDQ